MALQNFPVLGQKTQTTPQVPTDLSVIRWMLVGGRGHLEVPIL